MFALLSARRRLAGQPLPHTPIMAVITSSTGGFIAHPVRDLSTAACVIIPLCLFPTAFPPANNGPMVLAQSWQTKPQKPSRLLHPSFLVWLARNSPRACVSLRGRRRHDEDIGGYIKGGGDI